MLAKVQRLFLSFFLMIHRNYILPNTNPKLPITNFVKIFLPAIAKLAVNISL